MVRQPASRIAPNSAKRLLSLSLRADISKLTCPARLSLPWHTSCPHHSRLVFISLQARSATCPIYIARAREQVLREADLVAVEDTRG